MKNKLSRNYLFVLAWTTAFNLLALTIRNLFEENTTYNFLLWNLFLSFLPLVFAWAAYLLIDRFSRMFFLCLSLLWLLFYPNAPYMISDLIHVSNTSPLVLYDTLIIFSFALLALFYGFYSLKIMHFSFQQLIGNKTATILVGVSIVLSSAGIYLGRILRLNSWDLFTHPFRVMATIFDHLFPVTKNPSTYVIILLFSVIQFFLWIMIKDLDEMEKNVWPAGNAPVR